MKNFVIIRAFRLRRKDLLLFCFFRAFRLGRKDLLLFCFFIIIIFFLFLDTCWSRILRKRQVTNRKYYYILVQISSAMNIRVCQLPVPAFPVSRRPFMFTLLVPRIFLFLIRTLCYFAHRLPTLRPTCCITNVNFQLLPFSSY